MRKVLALWVVCALLAPGLPAWAQVVVSPFSASTPLVTMWLAPGVTSDAATETAVESYADQVSAVTGARVLLIPIEETDPRDKARIIADANAALYWSGRPDQTGPEHLVGTILVGDIAFPTVEKNDALTQTVYPWVDFVRPSYVRVSDPESDADWVWTPGGDEQPEIWHGVIPFVGEELQQYLQHVADVHQGVTSFAPRVWVEDEAYLQQPTDAVQARMYQARNQFFGRVWNQTVTGALLDSLATDIWGGVTVPDTVEIAPADTDWNALPWEAAQMMVSGFLKTFTAMHEAYLQVLHDTVSGAGRWAPSDTDTTIQLVHQYDTWAQHTLWQMEQGAWEAFRAWAETSGIARRVDLNPLVDENCGDRPLYWYGVPRGQITDASQCTILRGTPDTGALAEMNTTYDVRTIDECYSYIGVTDDNPFNNYRQDPREGCCASNLGFDEETGQMVSSAPACVEVQTDDSITSVSRWANCDLADILSPRHHIGPEEPIYSAASGIARPTGDLGAAGCGPILAPWGDPTEGQVDSLYIHDEPTPETKEAQQEYGFSAVTPVDWPRGISFYDLGTTPEWRRVNMPTVDAYPNTEAYHQALRAQAETINSIADQVQAQTGQDASPRLDIVDSAVGQIPDIYVDVVQQDTEEAFMWLGLSVAEKQARIRAMIQGQDPIHASLGRADEGYEAGHFHFTNTDTVQSWATTQAAVGASVVTGQSLSREAVKQWIAAPGRVALVSQAEGVELGSIGPSIEDVSTGEDEPWTGSWKPLGGLAAGMTMGEASLLGASDAVVVWGDPTYALAQKDELLRRGGTGPDGGNRVWTSPYGAIDQVLTVDINADQAPDIVAKTGDRLWALYGDPTEGYRWRETGEIARLRGEPIGEVVKHDHNGDGFWELTYVMQDGTVRTLQNNNGVFRWQDRTFETLQELTNVKGGDITGDELIDLVVSDAAGGLWVLEGTQSGWTDPRLLDSFVPRFAPVTSTYRVENVATDPLGAYRYPLLFNIFLGWTGAEPPEESWRQALRWGNESEEYYLYSVVEQSRVNVDNMWRKENDVWVGRMGLQATESTDDVTLMIPRFGGRRVVPESVRIDGEEAESVQRVPGTDGVVVEGIDLPSGAEVTLEFTLEEVEPPTVAYTVVEDATQGHRVLVPWTDPNGQRVVYVYDRFGQRTEPFTGEPEPTLDDLLPGTDSTDEEIQAALREILNADQDGDGISDALDPFPGWDQFTGTPDQLLDELDGERNQGRCGVDGCGRSLSLPSVAFLAPGNSYVYAPPASIPLPPTPGLPVFWLPPPPISPTHLASLFRLYVMPTTSLRVGIAACGAAFGGLTVPAWIPNCMLVTTPQINLPRQCPALPPGYEPIDSPIVNVPASSCEIASLGQELGGTWPSGQMDLTPDHPLSTQSAFGNGAGGNIQGGGADFITTWVAAQVRELANFHLPQVRITAPRAPEGANGYLQAQDKPVVIHYPGLPNGYGAEFAQGLNQWNQSVSAVAAQIAADLGEFSATIGDAYQVMQSQMIAQLLELQRMGMLPAGFDIAGAVASYMQGVQAQVNQELALVADFLQDLRTTTLRLGENQARLAEYRAAVAQLLDLPTEIEGLEENIRQLEGEYATALSSWTTQIGQAVNAWISYTTAVESVLVSFGQVSEIFKAFGAQCAGCSVGRGKGMDFLINILLSAIDLPLVRLPSIPDIIVDLTGVELGVTYDRPVLRLQKVPVEGLPVPTVPDAPTFSIPRLPLVDLRQALLQAGASAGESLGGAIGEVGGALDGAGEGTDLPEGGLDGSLPEGALDGLPDVPESIALEDLFGLPSEAVTLPPVPEVPEWPELSVPVLDIDIPDSPDLDLPLPPSPPELPENPLDRVIDAITALEGFLDFFCLLQRGVVPVAEWNLRSALETATNRTEFTPFDFILPAQQPPHRRPSVEPIVVEPEADLATNITALHTAVEAIAGAFNCVTEGIAGGDYGCSLDIGLEVQPWQTETYTLDFTTQEAVVEHHEDSQLTETVKQAVAKLEQTHTGHTTWPEYTQLVQTTVDPQLVAQTPFNPSGYPSVWPQDVAPPGQEVQLVYEEGTYCDPDSGMGIRVTNEDIDGRAFDVEFLKPDYHRSQGLHPLYAESDLCGEEGLDLVYSLGSALHVKSCAAQWPTDPAPDTTWVPWQDATNWWTPATQVFERTRSDAATWWWQREDDSVPYYEWRLSERPDALFDLASPHVSTTWHRLGLLLRQDAREYEIRPMTSRVVDWQGDVELSARPVQVLPLMTEATCDDPTVPKPYFDRTTVFVARGDENRMKVRVPPRPNQPEESLEITLRAGEETFVERGYVCLTRGSVEAITNQPIEPTTMRDSLYLTDGTRMEVPAGGWVNIELHDGTRIRLNENEVYEVRLFDQSIQRMEYTRSLASGGWYGALHARAEDTTSGRIHGVYSDPQARLDTTPPQVEVMGGPDLQGWVLQSLVLDLSPTQDATAIERIWVDTNRNEDTDNDGDPTNDPDEEGDTSAMQIVVELSSTPSTSAWRVWAEDTQGNRGYQDLRITTAVPTLELLEVNTRAGQARGRILEEVEGVEVYLERERDGVWERTSTPIVTDADGRFSFAVEFE